MSRSSRRNNAGGKGPAAAAAADGGAVAAQTLALTQPAQLTVRRTQSDGDDYPRGPAKPGGPAKRKLDRVVQEEADIARTRSRITHEAGNTLEIIETNKHIIQEILKLATSIFSANSILSNPDSLGKIMVNGKELCFNLGSALINVVSMCTALGSSVTNLANLVNSYLNSEYNNGILLGMLLTVLIQKRKILVKLMGDVEETVAVKIRELNEKLNTLTYMLNATNATVINFLIDYLSAGPVINRIGDIMTKKYEEELRYEQKIDAKLREQRMAHLIKMFDAANAEKAIKAMLERKQTPAAIAANHDTGASSQGANAGGSRSRRRTKRRGTKSKRKHAKKRTKRRRKHSRSTKKRYRKNKMKKRKTKRRRKMRGGGKWGTGSCPGDFMSDGSKTGETPPPAETSTTEPTTGGE